MGKRQRDSVECGGPVGIIGRDLCCRCTARARDASAKQPCPDCSRSKVLVGRDRSLRSRRCAQCGHKVRFAAAVLCRGCQRKADLQARNRTGIGVRTGARILLEVGDGSAFASAVHLASYAGIAPVTHRSGTSIRGNTPPDQVIANSNAPCSSLRSPRCTTPPAAPTTTENELKERSATPPHLPRQTPLRCSLRHAQEPRTLSITRRDCR